MKNDKVFVNLRIVVAIFVYVMIITMICFGIIFDLETGSILVESETDILFIKGFFIVLTLLLNIVIFLVSIPKWFVKIIFSKTGLYIVRPFQENAFVPYSNICQITVATYNHIGMFPKYIVFSKRKLSEYEKTHINLIDDENVIILRHRKKVLRLIEKYQLKCT